jgi:hypothetical protein
MFGFVGIILTQRVILLLRRWWLFLVDVERKILPCFFEPDVWCSYRKSERFTVMARCFKCKYYLEFIREMEEEEEKFWEEEERLRREGSHG